MVMTRGGVGVDIRRDDSVMIWTEHGRGVQGWLASSQTMGDDVAALQAELAADEANIASLTAATVANTSSITSLNTASTALGTRLTVDEGAITALQAITAPAAYLTLSPGGTLSILNSAIKWVARANMSLIDIVCSVAILPLLTSINVDVKKNGTTIFTSAAKPTIPVTGSGISAVCIPDVKSFVSGDVLTVDLTQVGTVTTGSGFQFSARYT